jgi:restriction system protein
VLPVVISCDLLLPLLQLVARDPSRARGFRHLPWAGTLREGALGGHLPARQEPPDLPDKATGALAPGPRQATAQTLAPFNLTGVPSACHTHRSTPAYGGRSRSRALRRCRSVCAGHRRCDEGGRCCVRTNVGVRQRFLQPVGAHQPYATAVTVPDFQSLMRPTLAILADGEARSQSQLRELLADTMSVTSEDREQLLPSGKQPVFANRVGWAITYLVKTGLLARPKRGYAQITDRGRKVLAEYPDRVDMAVLSQFPEFAEFRTPHPVAQLQEQTALMEKAELSPTESIAALVDEANSTVAGELLSRVLAQPPLFLERLVLLLLSKMGYGGLESTTEHMGGPADEGLDGVIRQDALGLDVIYVQAKRYSPDRKIGRPDLQAFVGALVGAKADRGIFITTSSFTNEARAYTRSNIGSRVVLIDGPQLARLMVERNVGVAIEDTYEIKRVDEDFFEE